MSERPTPRTASAMLEIPSKFDSILVVRAEVACDLERELGDALRERDEALSERDILRLDAQREAENHDRMVGELEKVYTERDKAREQVKELIYIAGRAIALAEIDFENDKFGVVSELRYGLEKIQEGAK